MILSPHAPERRLSIQEKRLTQAGFPHRANEVTSLQNKKTIMPADVFRALDDIEFGFMRERVEAEFSSTPLPLEFSRASHYQRFNARERDANITLTEFNETQTTKRSAYRKKVSAAKKATKPAGGGDTSMAETEGDTAMSGADAGAANLAAGSSAAGPQHRSKKARTDGGGDKMDVDVDDVEDASDPESVPDEDEEDDEDEAPEEEDEDEEDGEDDNGQDENGEERDDLEEREGRPDEDEALDDGNNSD